MRPGSGSLEAVLIRPRRNEGPARGRRLRPSPLNGGSRASPGSTAELAAADAILSTESFPPRSAGSSELHERNLIDYQGRRREFRLERLVDWIVSARKIEDICSGSRKL